MPSCLVCKKPVVSGYALHHECVSDLTIQTMEENRALKKQMKADPEIVHCRDCSKVHTQDCPLIMHEYVSPNDTERTWFTNYDVDVGFCCFGEARNPKPTTNYEHIRRMSVEEMAVTIMCPNDTGMAEIDCDHSDDKDCCKCTLEWLQSDNGG